MIIETVEQFEEQYEYFKLLREKARYRIEAAKEAWFISNSPEDYQKYKIAQEEAKEVAKEMRAFARLFKTNIDTLFYEGENWEMIFCWSTCIDRIRKELSEPKKAKKSNKLSPSSKPNKPSYVYKCWNSALKDCEKNPKNKMWFFSYKSLQKNQNNMSPEEYEEILNRYDNLLPEQKT